MILEFKNVCKTYRSGCKALKHISFTMDEGEIIAVIGASGAGKSTLLRCINRLVNFDDGEIFFDAQSVGKISRKNLKKMRANIGMIFQNYNLVERLNAVENVLHGCLGSVPAYRGAFGFYTEKEKQTAFSLLETVGMQEFAYRRCSELSGGQKQRIGIARALMQNPKLLLCDEPIASLDPQSSETVLNYIKEFSIKKHIACIINLHQIDYAKKYAARIIALRNGELVFNDVPEKLTEAVLYNEVFTGSRVENTGGYAQ